MGNQHSSSKPSTPASSHPQSPVGSSSHHASHGHPHPHLGSVGRGSHEPHQSFRTGRRQSVQHTIPKVQAAPPSATYVQASSESAPRPSSRGRASTVADTVTSQLRATHDRIVRDPSSDKMGNEQSSQKKEREREEKEKSSRQHTPQPAPSSSRAPPPEAPAPQCAAPSRPTSTTPPPAAPSPATRSSDVHAIPIDAPPSSRTEQAIAGSLEPADASQDYLVPSSHFNRPPRLPLPIEEEPHTPGSPIISPADIDHGEIEGALPRRTSMLSSTTADDDDLGEEFKTPTPGRPTVPTLIEWEGEGERVYVTGTFAGWNRKYRLHNK